MSNGGSSSVLGSGSSGPTKFKITGTVIQGRETETAMAGGNIVLQAGGPVSGATVTVTNLNTGGTTTSDSNGNFSITVPAVSSEISVSKSGVGDLATENVNEEPIGGDVIGTTISPGE